MKMKLILSLIAAAATAIVVMAAVKAAAPEAAVPPLTELWLNVNPTNYLAANRLRFTPQGLAMDAQSVKPIGIGNLEAWAEEVDNGVTNQVIIRSTTLNIPPAQLVAWGSSSDGRAFVESAMLQKFRMTRRQ